MAEKCKTSMTNRRQFLSAAGGVAGVATLAATALPVSAVAAPKGEMKVKAGGEPYPVNPTIRSPKTHKHPSDFTVITVGTGCPDTIVGRSGPSAMVQYKGKYFLTDVGAGTSWRLVEAGIDMGKISNVLITHMHTDHTDGYVKFMIESWTLGRRATNIVGVPGVEGLHQIFKDVFQTDIAYRLGKTGTEDGIYNKVKITELEGDQKLMLDGVKISTTPTIHAVYNLAYRFDVDGKSIVVSGDTSYNENLIKLAKDCDVLVLDVGRVVEAGKPGYIGPGEFKLPPWLAKAAKDGKEGKPMGPPKIDPATYVPQEVAGKSHGSLEDMSILAAKANVKKLVLTHYPPFAVDIEKTLKVIQMFYKGEVVFGQDMLEIEA
jgi:ribonuclease BN (tRNA processing enzyme)